MIGCAPVASSIAIAGRVTARRLARTGSEEIPFRLIRDRNALLVKYSVLPRRDSDGPFAAPNTRRDVFGDAPMRTAATMHRSASSVSADRDESDPSLIQRR